MVESSRNSVNLGSRGFLIKYPKMAKKFSWRYKSPQNGQFFTFCFLHFFLCAFRVRGLPLGRGDGEQCETPYHQRDNRFADITSNQQRIFKFAGLIDNALTILSLGQAFTTAMLTTQWGKILATWRSLVNDCSFYKKGCSSVFTL